MASKVNTPGYEISINQIYIIGNNWQLATTVKRTKSDKKFVKKASQKTVALFPISVYNKDELVLPNAVRKGENAAGDLVSKI